MRAPLPVLAALGLLGLGACDKMGLPTGNTSSTGDSSAAAANDDGAARKLDSYVEAHNKLMDTFGFEEEAESYRKSNISHASISGPFNVDAGWIDQGVKKLKAARAMSGGSPDLDAAADALISSMDKAQTHLASLETYYESKKYLDDKLARGKAEDGQMLAELDAAERDFKAFGALLDVALDRRDEALLEKLKGSDNLLGYNTKLALIHAKKLVNLFNGPDDVKKPELFAKGDAEVAIIEKAIADAHSAATKAGKGDPTGLSSLTSMIGSYRSLKQEHEVTDLKSMVSEYNQAVDSMNTFGGME
jgi:hypothetical protein